MAETQGKDEGKKSSKKLIIIIALVVLALAGGGAAYFFLAKPAENGKEAEAEKHGEDKHAESAHEAEAEHDKPVEPDVYYELPTPLLVDFPSGSSARVIKISLTVLTKGEASIEAMKKHEPMIRNNLLMAISSLGADKAKTLEGKQELRAMMQQEIGKVLEKMAGKNTVKEVYFTDFVMQ
ncbi:flagellar basal body-associated FliL family protein [Methylomonas koyamae]|uniref:flagellar basal body-associated FliL family protein n=1 Tax=Methylomonas koyamae TaxID=702114 RepID=UPI001C33A493|nr:flagellar basal body-associated FliL family protein [Methylomonas koyamae]BBL56883.1 flagellar basal body-associated protein FliL [Methylomonas koyamae]